MTHAPSRYENEMGVVDAEQFLEEQSLPKDATKTKLEHAVVKGTPILAAAAIATGCAYVTLNNPETAKLGPECGFFTATGLYCPGCGMTRAVSNVIQGDILRATRFNAMLVIALPVLIYLYVWWATWSFTGRELPKPKITRFAVYTIVALIIVFSVGRNFPGTIPEFFSLGRV